MAHRIVRDSILQCEKVAGLSFGAEVMFRRLMSVADDFGRYDGMVELIRAACFPVSHDKATSILVKGWLKECQHAGLIACYTAMWGMHPQSEKPFIEIINFKQPVRLKSSKYPPRPGASPADYINRYISPEDRATVLSVGKCEKCGATDQLAVDHKKPVSRKGTSHISNLQCLCKSCNSKKGATWPT